MKLFRDQTGKYLPGTSCTKPRHKRREQRRMPNAASFMWTSPVRTQVLTMQSVLGHDLRNQSSARVEASSKISSCAVSSPLRKQRSTINHQQMRGRERQAPPSYVAFKRTVVEENEWDGSKSLVQRLRAESNRSVQLVQGVPRPLPSPLPQQLWIVGSGDPSLSTQNDSEASMIRAATSS